MREVAAKRKKAKEEKDKARLSGWRLVDI